MKTNSILLEGFTADELNRNFAELHVAISKIPNSTERPREVEKPISQPEAIEFLGKSRQTLVTWRKKGIITGHSLGGRIYYLKSELLMALR